LLLHDDALDIAKPELERLAVGQFAEARPCCAARGEAECAGPPICAGHIPGAADKAFVILERA